MSKIESLIDQYKSVLREPWSTSLSGQEKVWFLIFDPLELKKVEFSISEFEIETKNVDKKWKQISLQSFFSDWLANHSYKEAYFEDPEYITDALDYAFKADVLNKLTEAISDCDGDTLIALTEVSSIFGFLKLSEVINNIATTLQGRLLVFFPGEFKDNQYRLMDARDGWNYLARPITI